MGGALVGNLAALIVMWLNGVEARAGSLAITMIVVSLAGVSKDMVTAVAIKYLVIALAVYLGSFVLVMLLGPLAGVMIANYWRVNKGNYDMQALYSRGAGSYWYRNGWSLSGYISLVLTWVVCYVIAALINQMAYINVGTLKVPFPGGVIWYFSVVVAMLLTGPFGTVLKEKSAN